MVIDLSRGASRAALSGVQRAGCSLDVGTRSGHVQSAKDGRSESVFINSALENLPADKFGRSTDERERRRGRDRTKEERGSEETGQTTRVFSHDSSWSRSESRPRVHRRPSAGSRRCERRRSTRQFARVRPARQFLLHRHCVREIKTFQFSSGRRRSRGSITRLYLVIEPSGLSLGLYFIRIYIYIYIPLNRRAD